MEFKGGKLAELVGGAPPYLLYLSSAMAGSCSICNARLLYCRIQLGIIHEPESMIVRQLPKKGTQPSWHRVCT